MRDNNGNTGNGVTMVAAVAMWGGLFCIPHHYYCNGGGAITTPSIAAGELKFPHLQTPPLAVSIILFSHPSASAYLPVQGPAIVSYLLNHLLYIIDID